MGILIIKSEGNVGIGKVCSICGKIGCHNANSANIGLGTTRPCVKLIIKK